MIEDNRANNVLLGIIFVIFVILGGLTMTNVLVFLASLFNPWILFFTTVIVGAITAIYAGCLNRGNMKNTEKVIYDKKETNQNDGD